MDFLQNFLRRVVHFSFAFWGPCSFQGDSLSTRGLDQLTFLNGGPAKWTGHVGLHQRVRPTFQAYGRGTTVAKCCLAGRCTKVARVMTSWQRPRLLFLYKMHQRLEILTMALLGRWNAQSVFQRGDQVWAQRQRSQSFLRRHLYLTLFKFVQEGRHELLQTGRQIACPARLHLR